MKKVRGLNPGMIFTYANEEFVVLGPKNSGVFCLLAQSKDDVEFYDGNEKPYNDYRKSKLQTAVNRRFLAKLFENGASLEDLMPYDLNLSETDGSYGYGVLQNVLAAPLTLWDYGKYKAAIPNNKNGAWWLATPFWTPQLPNTDRSGNVWGVGSDGFCHSWGCNNISGERPAIILKNNVLIHCENDSSCLEDVDTEDLLREIKRRMDILRENLK